MGSHLKSSCCYLSILKFIFIGVTPVLFISCLRTYFPIADQTSATPMVFENSIQIDSSSSEYLSSDITIGKGNYDNENLQLLKLSYLIADTRDHTNFNLEFWVIQECIR